MSTPLACALAWSSSQYFEDVLLLPTLVRAVRDHQGVFVEAGALDGVRFSNTLLLERCFNWTGLLIEADPRNYGQLKHSGRTAVKVQSAFCNESRSSVPWVHSTRGELAAQADVASVRGRGTHVNCSTMTMIMRHAGFGRADLLSLDVQGAEDIALSTCDPAVFRVVVVEVNGGSSSKTPDEKDERVRRRLLGAGLRLASRALQPFGSEVWLARDVVEVPVPLADQPKLPTLGTNISKRGRTLDLRMQISRGHWAIRNWTVARSIHTLGASENSVEV